MEEFSIIANLTLTNKEVVIYSNDRGAVLKTIILNAPTQTEVVLTFDKHKSALSLEGNDYCI